jgi:hypothetical protein
MKKLIIIIALCSIIACEKKDIDVEYGNIPSGASEILNKLNEAYDQQSKEKLNQILEKWHLEYMSAKTDNIENDTVRNAYQVYLEFYTPFDIGRLGGSEWGDGLYSGVSYAIIQNKLTYDFDYESLSVAIFDTIFDFRPAISFNNGVKTLYLTENYVYALNNFLGDEYNPVGTGGIMNPATAGGDSYEKQQFLNNYLKIIYGHWGGYWHLETHPEVYRISFDYNMENAIVYFRLVYEGGKANLTRQDGEWKLVSSRITWVE